ncbi:MAG: hypothetical protein KBD83_08680 [Gammaproteobacteria bacterium]|nr:hypothetical protein [Gammaproteobacteria bacterium]
MTAILGVIIEIITRILNMSYQFTLEPTMYIPLIDALTEAQVVALENKKYQKN